MRGRSHPAIGERCYLDGHTSGIAPDAWDTIRRNPVFLEAPITTPQGGGYTSLNVTIRKTLNLYANVRPSKSYAPFVAAAHPGVDLVVVRENEEDLYAGIEHRQTDEVAQVLKLVTRPGSERIVRYAFEYARAHGRRRVTCMSKDDIMKHTDGLFHRVFDEVATEYPDLESDHSIIDIGAARLAARPEDFDVVVTLNLYGDIISDIASEVTGSVGLGGSADIGDRVSMFEAVHGSAPDIAGRDLANPSGLILAATQLLVHVGASEVAERVKNAWLTTIEDGVHTGDVFRDGVSTRRVGTSEFTDAVIERLGRTPERLVPVTYRGGGISVAPTPTRPTHKRLAGVDVCLDWSDDDRDPNVLGSTLAAALPERWRLDMITNRGVKVFPDGLPETFCTDHWRCRLLPHGDAIAYRDVLAALAAIDSTALEIIKTEHLYDFDGEAGYSLGQGQ